jgi:hypothetical protein
VPQELVARQGNTPLCVHNQMRGGVSYKVLVFPALLSCNDRIQRALSLQVQRPPSSTLHLEPITNRTKMDPPYPSMTSLWHTSAYPSIESATATGKTVVVTGASSGIGRATAIAFAKAGAKHVALIGRREQMLEETKSLVEKAKSDVKVTTHALDVKDLAALKKAAEGISHWDVLILNAGRIMKPAKVEEADPELWWDVLEVWNCNRAFCNIH